MKQIPEAYQDLMADDAKNAFAVVATVAPDGSPAAVPVWFLADDDCIRFSSHLNSQKARNIRDNPHVSLCIMTEDNHVRYVEVRGRVVEISGEGWGAYSRRIKRKYPGGDEPSDAPPPGWAIFTVVPDKVLAFDYT